MSTAVTNLISDAYRESNLMGIGDTPTSAEQTEALVLLNRFIDSLFGAEMGENLINIPLGTHNMANTTFVPIFYPNMLNQSLPVNVRLLCNLDSAQTVNLNPQPFDGSRMQFVDVSGNFQTFPLTIVGNGRNIMGNPSLVLSANNYNQSFFYRGDLANWQILNDLTLTDSSPFPEEFDDMLIVGLAMRINVRNGIQMNPETADRYRKIKGQFYARYAQKPQVGSELGLLRIPSNRAYRYFTNYDFGGFQRGIPWW